MKLNIIGLVSTAVNRLCTLSSVVRLISHSLGACVQSQFDQAARSSWAEPSPKGQTLEPLATFNWDIF